jgi:hypothetical protein
MSIPIPRFSVCLIALLSAACSDATGVARIGPPAAIELLSNHTVLTIAGAPPGAAIRVVVKDANGNAVPGASVEFERVRRIYNPEIQGIEALFLGARQTDAEGIASFVPEMPTLAWEYDVRARLSTGAAKPRGEIVTPASVHYYVRPDVMIGLDVTPDTVTITGPVHMRAALLRVCGRDRFGNCTNDGFQIRNLTDSILRLEDDHGTAPLDDFWAVGVNVGDGAIVATAGPYSDTAFVRVR